jgi:hypothetical protein
VVGGAGAAADHGRADALSQSWCLAQLFSKLLAMSDGQLRFLGLASLACGGLLLLLL